MGPDDKDMEQLKALPARDVGEAEAGRLGRHAALVFEREHALAERPWVSLGVRLWSRVVLPAVLATTVGVYLLMAISAASALYR
jgi:hypothetical protein